jgi:hypothetical protein
MGGYKVPVGGGRSGHRGIGTSGDRLDRKTEISPANWAFAQHRISPKKVVHGWLEGTPRGVLGLRFSFWILGRATPTLEICKPR